MRQPLRCIVWVARCIGPQSTFECTLRCLRCLLVLLVILPVLLRRYTIISACPDDLSHHHHHLYIIITTVWWCFTARRRPNCRLSRGGLQFFRRPLPCPAVFRRESLRGILTA